jgi:hypothetical protein
VEQLAGDPVGDPSHALSVLVGERLPARLVLAQRSIGGGAAPLAQLRDRGQDLEARQPALEARQLLVDDRLGPTRLLLADGQVARDLSLDVVQVIELDPGEATC